MTVTANELIQSFDLTFSILSRTTVTTDIGLMLGGIVGLVNFIGMLAPEATRMYPYIARNIVLSGLMGSFGSIVTVAVGIKTGSLPYGALEGYLAGLVTGTLVGYGGPIVLTTALAYSYDRYDARTS